MSDVGTSSPAAMFRWKARRLRLPSDWGRVFHRRPFRESLEPLRKGRPFGAPIEVRQTQIQITERTTDGDQSGRHLIKADNLFFQTVQ